MRPLVVRCQAFGSFPGLVELDLRELADHGLFLVHGPTGAGKTTLLDALSYALYGEVPGARRADGLRSHHAPLLTPTFVEVELALRGEEWLVRREPGQARPKRRGGGTTVQAPRAFLHRRIEGRWTPVASGVVEVAERVRDLVGLDAHQFRQVVVLPQGEVEQALRADARERERLLSSLFGTGRFTRATELLRTRAREVEEQAALVAERLDGRRAHAARTIDRLDAATRALRPLVVPLGPASAPPTLPGFEPPGGDGPSGADDPDGVTGAGGVGEADAARLEHATVVAWCDAGARAVAELDADLARARARTEALDAALAAARLVSDRWTRRDAAEAELVHLVGHAEMVAAARRTLADAERAEPVREPAADLERIAVAAEAAARAEVAARRGLVRAVPDHPAVGHLRPLAAVARWTDPADVGDAALAAARDAAVALAARLDAVATDLARADQAEALARHHRAAAEAAQAALVAQSDEREALAAALAAARGRLDDERVRAARAADLAQTHAVLGEQVAAAAGLGERRARHLDAREAAVGAAERAATAQAALLQLHDRRLAGIAAELAGRLVDGAACPVCGAVEHPSPTPALADPVTDAQLAAAEQRVKQAQVAAQRAGDVAAELAAGLVAGEARAGDAAADPTGAARRLDELAAELAAARAAAAAVGPLDAQLRADVQRLAELDDGLRTAGAAVGAEAATASALAAEAAERRRSVVEALGRPETAGLGELVAGLGRVVAAADRLAVARHEVGRVAELHAEAEARLARACRRAGFPDASAAAAAWLEPARRERTTRLLQQRDERERAARAVLADPELVALVDRPDVDAALAAAERARAGLEAVVVARTGAAEAQRELVAAADALADLERTATEVAEQASALGALADLCHGGATNPLRLSLERWVLGAHLEAVAAAASVRFAAMSDGRYSLSATDDRTRGAGGLQLVVHDAHTGVTRDPGTLSGGETFQASLALALGLADVVQAESGGVHLDALFVDEGFGSLDPDALEDAMAELDRLRAGGRLVGVISHVPALRERIPAGIEVTRTPAGSTARVVVRTGVD